MLGGRGWVGGCLVSPGGWRSLSPRPFLSRSRFLAAVPLSLGPLAMPSSEVGFPTCSALVPAPDPLLVPVHPASEAVVSDKISPGFGGHRGDLAASIRAVIRFIAAADAAALRHLRRLEGVGSGGRVLADLLCRLLQETADLRSLEALGVVEIWKKHRRVSMGFLFSG